MSEIREYNGKKVLFVDGRPFYAVAGEVHNSDSSSLEYMEGIWKIADELGLNTLLLPVSWELIEAAEGDFHFELPDGLIDQARSHGKKIIFLWFGSWKNAEMMYAPSWVKKDRKRFRRAQIVKGEDKSMRSFGTVSLPYYSLSYLCKETMEADGKAFAAFMRHLKRYDEKEGTVIGIQVENETGLLGNAREVSAEADAVFAADVPASFVSYMKEHTDTMKEDVKAAVEKGKESGSWKEVFNEAAEEIFSAYHVSRFVNHVAEMGRKEYDLPLFANCWLVHKGDAPGKYPSGGPVSRMHEVWRYGAPCIDVFCPDIYVPEFLEVCDDYGKDQPLMIPEAATHSYAASRLAYCIGHYHAMAYSPFGFDDIGKPFTAVQGFLFGMNVEDPALKEPQDPDTYAWFGRTLSSMEEIIAPRYGTADLQAVCAERKAKYNHMSFGKIGISVFFQNPLAPIKENGVALGVKTAEDEVFLITYNCILFFNGEDAKNMDILEFEEGRFTDGKWKAGRRLNGDEAATLMINEPKLLRLKVFTYNDD
ncbi:MAG: DUF5597 domain-containing protein [Erysipelotrichaceae bacterium]|nr:DUF5597 domain-containing protein [Erysipelotrichaceae bacterium]